MKEIFLHRNPNTRTKYNNTTASLDTMNSKTLWNPNNNILIGLPYLLLLLF
jgi:hypothetical protein